MLVLGLQTKGIFCCHCTIAPEHILVGALWLRDRSLLSTQISLTQSEIAEGDRFLVELPADLPEFSKAVELKRVL